MELVKVNGCLLNVKIDYCAQDAPWIIFGNSLVTDLSIWDAQVAAFNGCFNILRYDQRGHGASTLSQVDLDFALFAQDLIDVMDHFAIANAVYIGLSMGVPIGLAAYTSTSTRFKKLIFINGQAKSGINAAASWQQRIELACTAGMNVFAINTAARWLVDDQKSVHLEQIIAATPLTGFSTAARVLKNYDFSETLTNIVCPVLLIAGAKDGEMPKVMQTMTASIANAQFKQIENAGHVPCFEQPHRVNQYIAKFLEERV